MIIVCDEESCAWRTRTWVFLVLWLFTAFMLGVYIVNLRHKADAERGQTAWYREEMRRQNGIYLEYLNENCPKSSTENLPLDTERKAD